MGNRQDASFAFQAPSMPFEAGTRVRAGSLSGTFEVLAFDGSTYRLRSETGAELRAGRKAVRAA